MWPLWLHECVNMTPESYNCITMEGENISHFFPSPSISIPRSYGYHHSKWKVELLHKCPTYPLPRSELSTILTFPFTKIVLGRDKGRVLSLSWGLELKGIKDSQDELFLRLQSTWNKMSVLILTNTEEQAGIWEENLAMNKTYNQLEHFQLNLINLTVQVGISSQDEVTSTSGMSCKWV